MGSLEDVSAFDLKRELTQSDNTVKALTALLKPGEAGKKTQRKPQGETPK